MRRLPLERVAMEITYRALGSKFSSLESAKAFVDGYLAGTEDPPAWGVKVWAWCGNAYLETAIRLPGGWR